MCLVGSTLHIMWHKHLDIDDCFHLHVAGCDLLMPAAAVCVYMCDRISRHKDQELAIYSAKIRIIFLIGLKKISKFSFFFSFVIDWYKRV